LLVLTDRSLLKTTCISFLLGQFSAIFDLLSGIAGTGNALSHVINNKDYQPQGHVDRLISKSVKTIYRSEL
jgi:hypothetical protein